MGKCVQNEGRKEGVMKQLETSNSRVPLSEPGEIVDCGNAMALEEGSHCQILSLKQGRNKKSPDLSLLAF